MFHQNQIKTFSFILPDDKKHRSNDLNDNTITVKIRQDDTTRYSSVIWPSAKLMCQFLIENIELFKSKTILELGSGTGICGILAAKIGAKMILSDHCEQSLRLIEDNLNLNNVQANLMLISWANKQHLLKNDFSTIDYIIGSDLCYEESKFENLLLTISYLMNNSSKPEISFYLTYHLRCSHHHIQCLLKKFQLYGKLLSHSDDYKIYLYQIKKLSPS